MILTNEKHPIERDKIIIWLKSDFSYVSTWRLMWVDKYSGIYMSVSLWIFVGRTNLIWLKFLSRCFPSRMTEKLSLCGSISSHMLFYSVIDFGILFRYFTSRAEHNVFTLEIL